METVPWLKVSSDRLVKPGIEPATPGLQGKWFIHHTTATPISQSVIFAEVTVHHVHVLNCSILTLSFKNIHARLHPL